MLSSRSDLTRKKTKIPTASRTRAIAPAKSSVSFALSGSLFSTGFGAEPIADAAHGLERARAEGAVEPVAELVDVDVDDVRVALEVAFPGVGEQLLARQYLPRVTHEGLEQGVLLLG